VTVVAPMRQIRRCRPLLGTYVEIAISGDLSEDDLHDRATAAFEAIGEVHRLMSFHDPESEVTLLNRSAHLVQIEVHEWTWAVLNAAAEMSRMSEGAFDITVAPQLVRSGLLPEHEPNDRPWKPGGWRSIRLEKMGDARRVFFDRPLTIDLGGIAKGFAVDRAIDCLAGMGEVSGALVNAGGDLRITGHWPGNASIRHPGSPTAALLPVPFYRKAMATSATYFLEPADRGHPRSQFIDPRKGDPVFSDDSVTIFSPNCVTADALTKIALVAPVETLDRCLVRTGSLALFIDPEGRLRKRGE
jgi:thiamine biosynthesis lipoprotein